MEQAVLGLGCILGGLCVLAIVLAIAALSRSSEVFRLRKRVEDLEKESRLRQARDSASGSARAPAESAAARGATGAGFVTGVDPSAGLGAVADPLASTAASAAAAAVAAARASGAAAAVTAALASAASAPAAFTLSPSSAASAGSPQAAPGIGGASADSARAGASLGGSTLPPRPPTPPAPPKPPRPPAPPINWEKVFGVGGAAVVGGIGLALAAFFFVKISIERGWISPALRVAIAIAGGVAAVGGSEALRRSKRDYVATANALAGAGIVILYSAFWSARVMYNLIDVGPAFGAMAMVTVVASLLSLRYSSLVVAVLALVGGFLTPLLINSGHDNPLGLFGYVLLLDAGMLAVARQKKWASIQVLAMLGTVVIEGLWIFDRMGPGTMLIGLGAVAVFAAVFAVSGELAPVEGRPGWRFAQGAGLLIPFGFALYFAVNARLGDDPIPTVALLVLLTAMAGFLGRNAEFDFLGLGAAGGSAAVMAVLLLTRDWDFPTTWKLLGMTVLLAAVSHVAAERRQGIALPRGSGAAAIAAALGLLVVVIDASTRHFAEPVGPWLLAELALGGLLLRQSAFAGRRWLQLAPAVLVPYGLTCYHQFHLYGSFPNPGVYLAILGVLAVLFQVNALVRSDPPTRRAGEHAAATAALVLLGGLMFSRLYTHESPALPALGLVAVLGFFAALAATRGAQPLWYLAAVGMTGLAHVAWVGYAIQRQGHEAIPMLAMLAVSAVLFTAWPFLAGSTFDGQRTAWRAAALATPIWFVGLRKLWETSFGSEAIGLLPIGLAVVALLAAIRAREKWREDDPIRKSALAWFAAVALGFISVTFPLQLDNQWITIGWALEGAAVIALWTRLDHRGLKYFGLVLLGAVTVRLVFNASVLEYEPRAGMRIFNWILYTYAVPAAALLVSASLLQRHELARARTWERPLYAAGHALGSMVASLGAIAVIFVLLNLQVIDWFATSDRLTLAFERMQSRDLAFSISWLLYAIALLVVGIVRESKGPRWISLGLLLVSIFKVALYDMGALRDFKLVFSLAGLGATLIVVSLVYQRFLFRAPAKPEAT